MRIEAASMTPDKHGRFHCVECGAYLPTVLIMIPDLPKEKMVWECQSCGQKYQLEDPKIGEAGYGVHDLEKDLVKWMEGDD